MAQAQGARPWLGVIGPSLLDRGSSRVRSEGDAADELRVSRRVRLELVSDPFAHAPISDHCAALGHHKGPSRASCNEAPEPHRKEQERP